MTIGCSAIILTDKNLAKFLYAKDFYSAWKYVPWLTIAIVFGSLSGFIGGFFSAVKDSKVFSRSTMIGAICNIILNSSLTPIIGVLGAAITTTASYLIVWIFRLIYSRKYIKMKINLLRDCSAYAALILQSVLLLLFEGSIMYMTEAILFTAIVIMFWREIMQVINKIENVILKWLSNK